MNSAAQALYDTIRKHNLRIVFAESCTGGLIAATLAQLPGISLYLCGSAVTYQNETKQAWLGVSYDDLNDVGAVSEVVAQQMAHGVLDKTAQADYAASITGHLGPDAPPDLDGIAFCSIYGRLPRDDATGGLQHILTQRIQLSQSTRVQRQAEAAGFVLENMRSAIETRIRDN